MIIYYICIHLPKPKGKAQYYAYKQKRIGKISHLGQMFQ